MSFINKLRVRVLVAAVLVSSLAGCGGGNDAGANTSTQGQPGTPTPAASGGQQSTNWSGYALTGSSGSFSKVEGKWTVPTVKCAASDNTASSSWAGIGGGTNSDPTLVQAGTEQDCSGGPSYYAWWEIIPLPSTTLDTQAYPVQAGDQITVTVNGSNAILWSITIKSSRGWTFNTSTPYTAAGATAEWIEEAPLGVGTGGAGQVTLANFGRVAFSALKANGASPGLAPADRIVMVDANDGHIVANTSAAGAGGNSFAVCFGSAAC